MLIAITNQESLLKAYGLTTTTWTISHTSQ